MRALFIRKPVTQLPLAVGLLAVVQTWTALIAAELVLFDPQFDLENITTQDATVSETTIDAGRPCAS